VPNGSAWPDSSKRTTACANQLLDGATLACSVGDPLEGGPRFRFREQTRARIALALTFAADDLRARRPGRKTPASPGLSAYRKDPLGRDSAMGVVAVGYGYSCVGRDGRGWR
jgi:hypothetical protein